MTERKPSVEDLLLMARQSQQNSLSDRLQFFKACNFCDSQYDSRLHKEFCPYCSSELYSD